MRRRILRVGLVIVSLFVLLAIVVAAAGTVAAERHDTHRRRTELPCSVRRSRRPSAGRVSPGGRTMPAVEWVSCCCSVRVLSEVAVDQCFEDFLAARVRLGFECALVD